MTTIAYHHESGLIACDGRSTQGIYITQDNAQKWLEIDGAVWFFTGSVHDRDAFLKYQSGELSGQPSHDIECSAFLVSGGKAYECGVTREGQAWSVELCYNHATGSGKDHAVASMDHGKGAVDSVRYAATRDTRTGGKISALDVRNGQWVALDE
jgi:hypothetical protein